MSGCRQAEALAGLSQAEGVEEVLVFSTCRRTEFVVWGDPTLAVNSVLRFLTAEYGLKLCDWNNFYRLLDDQALLHAFRVGCGLASNALIEKGIARQVSAAWQQGRNAGTTGRFLDAVLRKTLAVRRRIRKETSVDTQSTSVSSAAVDLCSQIFGSLATRNIVLIGAGRVGDSLAQEFKRRGAQSIAVISRSESGTHSLAQIPGVQTCTPEGRWSAMVGADLVMTATSSPGFVITGDDIRKLAAERDGRKLVLIDLALPRDIDPEVRKIDGVLLYDLEDLQRAFEPHAGTRAGESEAEAILLAEVRAFKNELQADRHASEPSELRRRLDEICRRELESFRIEQGPFPKDQDQLITAMVARLAQRIAGSLSREMQTKSRSASI